MTAEPVLTQFLVDVTRGHRRDAFRADREAEIAASRLGEALRDAVRREDVAALWAAGAHPMALLYFARACGWTSEAYYRSIDSASSLQSRTR